MKVYYVEDEKDLAGIVGKYLIKEGFDVTIFYSGEEAKPHAGDPAADLWILDIMMPGDIDGFDLIKEIKSLNPGVPVFFTSARDQALDKIKGLELGSDDYLAKPFSPRELVLRVKAILKRNQGGSSIIHYDDYTISVERREITYEDQIIDLTNKEFEMLLAFLRSRGEPIERKAMLESVWRKDYKGSDRVVDDLLRRLRQKLPNLRIETIYGYGYRLL